MIVKIKGELKKSELDKLQTFVIEVISKTLMEKSQNKEENEFLRSIVSTLKEIGVVAVLLCDRGVRRVSWIKLLKESAMTSFYFAVFLWRAYLCFSMFNP